MSIPAIRPYPMPTEQELPSGPLPWRCDPRRAVLLIHDMQQYFVDFFPFAREPVTTLVRNITAIRQAATRAGLPVIYTAQPGGMTREQRGLLFDLWGPGMGTDPEQRRILPELAPTGTDIVLTKWRYSAFARSNLERILREWERDQLIICGIYAHVGILMTACDAFTRDIQPFVVGDAIADFTPEFHRLALDYAVVRCAPAVATRTVLNVLATTDAGSTV